MEASLFVGLSSMEPFHSCRHALHVQCMPISWNKREFSHMKRVQSPRLVCDTNMTIISLFWDMNMANVTSGEQGWCSGESTRLQKMWPRFKSWCRHHMWVEFVGSLPCSKTVILFYLFM